MADRVAFIGGSVSGVDHFPFNYTLSGSSGFYDRFQISVSVDELAWMYWRVRSWRVYGSATRVVGMSSFSDSWDFEIFIGDDVEVGQSTLTREAELVLAPRIISTDDWVSEEGGVFGCNLFEFVALLSGPILKPMVEGTIYAGSGIGTFITMRKGAPYTVTVPGLDAHIIIDGATYPLTFYTSASDTGTTTGTFYIEAASFWPYATKAGLPVYDTATGAQLRDPLS